MRVFTFGELWGTFPCEQVGCEREASAVILTDEENKRLPEEFGPKAAAFIFQERLGKASCDECLKDISG